MTSPRMHRRLAGVLALVAAGVLLTPRLPAAEPPGVLEFRAENRIYDANGTFKRWRFTHIDIPGGDLERGTVEIEVELASVWEKAAALAEHLRTADFFDVERFATATIRVDRLERTGDATYHGIATLDLHGRRGEVPVEVEVLTPVPLTVEGTAVLSRTAFGIGPPYDPANEKSIRDQVKIRLEAVLE